MMQLHLVSRPECLHLVMQLAGNNSRVVLAGRAAHLRHWHWCQAHMQRSIHTVSMLDTGLPCEGIDLLDADRLAILIEEADHVFNW